MRFVVDAMLGKLARWLRLLGHDTVYEQVLDDEVLISIAKEEDRILVTRDESLFKKAYKYGVRSFLIKSTDLTEELLELSPFLDESAIGSRCTICNTVLVEVDRSRIPAEDLPEIYPLWRCPKCGKIYWHGSHWRGIEERIKTIKR
ncbi:MAG: Mut7-C RNAse domain-containing protein [Candidatus Methanomethylicaceae archaeon]